MWKSPNIDVWRVDVHTDTCPLHTQKVIKGLQVATAVLRTAWGP